MIHIPFIHTSFQMPVYSVKAHSEIINCIDGCGGLGIGIGAPEIVTGSRDGKTNTMEFRYMMYTMMYTTMECRCDV